MPESISFDRELRQAIKETVTTLARAVKGTLGPVGTNVGVLSELYTPLIVNDGVTVAKKIKFKDPLKQYIAGVLKTVSQNTENQGGDGTTTSITLAEAIILEGLKHIEVGASHIDIAKGIGEAAIMVLKEIDKNKIPVEGDMLLQVATISSNNDREIGKIISEAFSKVGGDGQIEIQNSTNSKTYVDMVPGMKYEGGFESNLFTNTDKEQTIFEDPNLLIYEGKLKSLQEIKTLLQDIRNENESLLIIADDYDKVFIDDLASVKIQDKVKVCAVRSPFYGKYKEDCLEDIALITQASIISRRYGKTLESLDKDSLGKAKTVKVDIDSFSIIEGSLEDRKILDKTIDRLKKKALTLTGVLKDEVLSRIARLSSGVAIMYVSGDSPIEVAEKKYRIEDAINSTRASLEEGVVIGGGVTLLKLSKALKMPEMENKDQEIGFNILIKALEAPIKTISENSGTKKEVVLKDVLKSDVFEYGYNAKTKKYENLREAGVLDPAKVTKAALTNSASVSQMLLTMNCCIFE